LYLFEKYLIKKSKGGEIESMFKYTKIGVNAISIAITILIFILIDLFIFNQNYAFQSNFNSNEIQEQNKSNVKEQNVSNNIIQEENYTQVNSENVEITIENQVNKAEDNEKRETKEDEEKNNLNNINWVIEIPAISLKAEISEGTTKEIMDSYVGHFEETSKTNGNIGLAAHNRGYPKNYFQNLKRLKEGDEIIYKYGEFQKNYVVEIHKIIEDVDWSYLKKTEENTITLITCVENEPKYRRCVQAVEKIDE